MNPETDIADAQVARQNHQQTESEIGAPTGVVNDKIREPEESVDLQPRVSSQQPNGTHPSVCSKHLRGNRLSVSNTKKAKVAATAKPATAIGTSDNPIDLEDYDVNDCPIQNVQIADLRNNCARAR